MRVAIGIAVVLGLAYLVTRPKGPATKAPDTARLESGSGAVIPPALVATETGSIRTTVSRRIPSTGKAGVTLPRSMLPGVRTETERAIAQGPIALPTGGTIRPASGGAPARVNAATLGRAAAAAGIDLPAKPAIVAPSPPKVSAPVRAVLTAAAPKKFTKPTSPRTAKVAVSAMLRGGKR